MKILLSSVLLTLILFPVTVFGASYDPELSRAVLQSDIREVKEVSNLPVSVKNSIEDEGGEVKGFVGKILSSIFNLQGRIKNDFIDALRIISGNYPGNIPRWDGDTFVEGSITDDGTNITVGGDVIVNGDMRADEYYYTDGTVVGGVSGGKFVDGTPTASEAVYTGGNVGIGLVDPEQALDVNGNIQLGVSNGNGRVTNGEGESMTFFNTLGITQFAVDNSEIMRLRGDSGGRVGIGTGNPQSKLHVSGQVTASSPTENNHLATKIYVDNALSSVSTGSGVGDNLGDHLATTELQMNGENISMSGGLISGLADPTGPFQATNKQYVDTLVSSITSAGGGDNLGNHIATQGLDMGDFRISNLNDPTVPNQAANKRYVDTLFASITASGGGDNLGNHIATQGLDMGDFRISNLNDPTVPNQAANKRYVDAAIASIPVGAGGGGKFVDGTPTASEAVYTGGNVGIGTTDPEQKLDVRGALQVQNTSGDGYFINGLGEQVVLKNSDNSMLLRTNGGTKVVINENGNVGIGAGVPGSKLDVNGKITMRAQTVDSDPDNMVATKGYVDNSIADVNGSAGHVASSADGTITGLRAGQVYLVSVYGGASDDAGIKIFNCSMSDVLATTGDFSSTGRGTQDSHVLAVVAPSDGCIKGTSRGSRNQDARHMTAWSMGANTVVGNTNFYRWEYRSSGSTTTCGTSGGTGTQTSWTSGYRCRDSRTGEFTSASNCTGTREASTTSSPRTVTCPDLRCFTSNTKILMADGSKKDIVDVKIGDIVINDLSLPTKVTKLHSPAIGKRGIYTINDTIESTGDHPFKTTSGWKVVNKEQFDITQNSHDPYMSFDDIELEGLKVGDILITIAGEETITSIEWSDERPESEKVYSFEIEYGEGYWADGYLVKDLK